jgi:N,N-dimethylformamidase
VNARQAGIIPALRQSGSHIEEVSLTQALSTVGYVSDEDYSALPDVLVDFERDGRTVLATRSTASGAVLADIPAGAYRVTLAKAGYGSKRVEMTVDPGRPYLFRLLSDRLAGFVWPKWVRCGDPGEFRIHAVEPYRLTLYRYGLQKELVRLIGWFDAHGPRTVMQITPDGDYSQTGVGWNRVGWGSPHHTQFVAAPKRSGLYYFHAHTESGAFFSFPWVVAPTRPQAEIAVLASSNNWNAYNAFGGRSNYVNACGLPPTPTVNARQDLQRYRGGAYDEWLAPDDAYAPLSFERPDRGCHVPEDVQASDPIEGRDACHLAPAEWRTLAWLEREGFVYDLYAEPQLDSGAFDLDAYIVLVLNVHPEYWSRAMVSRVKEWVQRRQGRLIYLGGNGLNCEIEYGSNGAMRCLTQVPGAGGAMNGSAGETGDFLESRFHRTFESEASLLGVVCTDAGIMTAAPYRVENAPHWAFAGTGLRNGDTFGHRSLHERVPGGASGHETDKRSPSSPKNTVLLAKGLNPDDGGAEMVVYETDRGGAVFSAGSITYAASLLVDEQVSRITRNVVERFLK